MIVFDGLAESRICPECDGPLRLYVTEQGIQLLACMNCLFDVADQKRKAPTLRRVRQMAARDRREHAASQERQLRQT